MNAFEDLKELALRTSSASISDAMGKDRHAHYMTDVLCQTPDKLMWGEAVTLRSLPARPDLVADVAARANKRRSEYPFEQALELCGPGRILVVDTSGYTHASIGGDVKLSRLHNLNAEGLVTDGSLRDKAGTTAYDFALFCSGFTPRSGTGTFLYGHDLNVPITCGGALVRPRDYLFGDSDGVVVIPRDRVEEVLARAASKEELDVFVKKIMKEEDLNPGEYYPISDLTRERFAQEKGISKEEIAW